MNDLVISTLTLDIRSQFDPMTVEVVDGGEARVEIPTVLVHLSGLS